MATLVLGTVGRAFGGPVGGIIGTAVGGFVDRGILGGRQGGDGRAGNLTVQSAAYGEAIPVVTGRMRVAGNLIWSAGIVETAGGGGKRNGAATSDYVYTASFAVGLAGRPISGIGRIWADGRLIRGSDGAFLAPTVMRLHQGGEAQAVDPLIAAAEGPMGTPAYRGTAYVVFEDLALVDFGNRIPNLTFEIIADDGPVDVGNAIAALAVVDGRPVAGVVGEFPAIIGHHAGSGGSIAENLAGLLELAGGAVVATPALRLVSGDTDQTVIDGGDADSQVAGEPAERERRRRTGGDSRIDAIEIGYFDPDRDFQPGLQRAQRGVGGNIGRQSVGAAMTAVEAKALAQGILGRRQAARLEMTLRLPWRYVGLRPGALVRVGDDQTVWRVRQVRFRTFVVHLDLERAGLSRPALAAAASGRALAFEDAAAGPTVVHLFDLPLLAGEAATASRLWVAASGPSPGWRQADVEISGDGGHSYRAVGNVKRGCVIGVAETALGAGAVDGWDRHAFVDVRLIADHMWIEGRSDEAVLDGANLALIGDELVQFSEVEALAPQLFRLSGLLRGRRGTEAKVGGHLAWERFVLVDPAAMLSVALPHELGAREVRARAQGTGEVTGAIVSMPAGGMAQRPLSPAHLEVEVVGGDVVASWVRRSRGGYGWNDFVDTPLYEVEEAYEVEVWLDGKLASRRRVVEARFVYSRAELARDGGGQRIAVVVCQWSPLVGRGEEAAAEFELDQEGAKA